MAKLSGPQLVAADVPGSQAPQPDLSNLRPADYGQAPQSPNRQTDPNDGTITVKATAPILKKSFCFKIVMLFH